MESILSSTRDLWIQTWLPIAQGRINQRNESSGIQLSRVTDLCGSGSPRQSVCGDQVIVVVVTIPGGVFDAIAESRRINTIFHACDL
jgi:hypothetical protein